MLWSRISHLQSIVSCALVAIMLLKVMPALPLSQRARSKSGGTLIWGAIFFFLSADYSGLG